MAAEMKDESTHKKVLESSIKIADKVLKGTCFEDDPESKALLAELKADFADVVESEAGQRLVNTVEKLGKKIIDEKSFSDAVKIIYHVVQQLGKSTMVKVGFFLLGIGALVALVGSLPFVAEGALAIWVLRILRMIGGVLMTIGVPTLVGGIKSVWEAFFSAPDLPDPSRQISGDSETDEEKTL